MQFDPMRFLNAGANDQSSKAMPWKTPEIDTNKPQWRHLQQAQYRRKENAK